MTVPKIEGLTLLFFSSHNSKVCYGHRFIYTFTSLIAKFQGAVALGTEKITSSVSKRNAPLLHFNYSISLDCYLISPPVTSDNEYQCDSTVKLSVSTTLPFIS